MGRVVGDYRRLQGCTEERKCQSGPLGRSRLRLLFASGPWGLRSTGQPLLYLCIPPLPSPLPSPPLTPLLSEVQASEITEEANSPRPREMLDPPVITAWCGRRSTQVAGIRPANRAELYPSARPSWLCLLLPPSPESQWSSGKQEQRLGFSLPGGSKEAGDG